MPRIIGPTPPRHTNIETTTTGGASSSPTPPPSLDRERDRLLPTLRGRRAALHDRLPANNARPGASLRRPTRRPAVSRAMLEDGKVLAKGDRGPAVSHTQALLQKHGFRTGRTGFLGARTQLKILAFQKANNLKQTGTVTPETYAALSKPPGALLHNVRGAALASAAEKSLSNGGNAFDNVLEAIDQTFGAFLYGNSAYMVPRQLNQHPDFREVKVPRNALKDLPAGAITVWGRTLENPNGDITIALGGGREVGSSVTATASGRDQGHSYRTFVIT